MNLTRDQMISTIKDWICQWNDKNLEAILAMFHEEISFENWNTICFKGKESVRKMLTTWFNQDQEFVFFIENIFADEVEQKVCYEWLLEWPSKETKYQGKMEKRRGVDIIYFKQGKIINKNVYSKTAVSIENKKHPLIIF